MEATKILYIGRSDGVAITKDGMKNRPPDSKIRSEVTTREKNDEYYVHVLPGDPKYNKALKEIGGLLARWANGRELLPDFDPHMNYRLHALPEGYCMYQHVTKSGVLEVNFFGHPRGVKSKFRLPSEFAHHIIWLVSDETTDPKNCTCVKCSPQGGKTKDDSAEAGSSRSKMSSSQVPESNRISSVANTPQLVNENQPSANAIPQPNASRGQGLHPSVQVVIDNTTQRESTSITQNTTPRPNSVSSTPTQPRTTQANTQMSTPQAQKPQISAAQFNPAGSGNIPGDATSDMTQRQTPTAASQPDSRHVHQSEIPMSASQPMNVPFNDSTMPSHSYGPLAADPNLDMPLHHSLGMDGTLGQNTFPENDLIDLDAGAMDSTPPFNLGINCKPTSLNQLYDIKMLHYYRPGELVWIDRGPKEHPVLAVVVSRSTKESSPASQEWTYSVVYLGNIDPLKDEEREYIVTNHETNNILPFLALPMQRMKDQNLLEAINSGVIDDDETKLFLYTDEGRATLCGQRVDRSYRLDTKLPTNDIYPFESRTFDLYKSLWLGAERIWPGDIIRVNLNPNSVNKRSSDIMVVTHIKETWTNELRNHSDRTHPFQTPHHPAPDVASVKSTVEVIGDIYSFKEMPSHNQEIDPQLPEPIIRELRRLNQYSKRVPNRPCHTRMLEARRVALPLTAILGRWYPFWILTDLYDDDMQIRIRRGQMDPPLASDYLFPRGQYVDENIRKQDPMGRRIDDADLLSRYRGAILPYTNIKEYEGSPMDVPDLGLPLCDDKTFVYDFGPNPFDWNAEE